MKKDVGGQEQNRVLVRRLAWLLDSSIRLPGTNFRIGWDAIIGLIPWVGDVAGSILSLSILGIALRMGASRWTLLRMGSNILVEMVVGAVPVFGDIFDAVYKANERNVRLLERSTLDLRAGRKDFWFLAMVVSGLILILASALYASFQLTMWAFHTASTWLNP